MDVASVPRLLEIPRDEIWWMGYEAQEAHQKDLTAAGVSVVPFLEVGETYAVRPYIEGRTLANVLDCGETTGVESWLENIDYERSSATKHVAPRCMTLYN